MKILCRNCGTNLINRVGQEFGRLKIVKELGNNKIKCKCMDCGYEDSYTKSDVVNMGRTSCRNCSLLANYKKRIINEITVMNFAYTGRNGSNYYHCQCNKCEENLLLTREEIIKYTCDKR